MNKTQTLLGIAPDERATAVLSEEAAKKTEIEQEAGRDGVSDACRNTRVKVAVIYALTTVIPLLVMFYIIQANVFLRTSMGVISVSVLAFIALGIALLGGKIMKEVWGKVGQAVESIERLRLESDPFKEISQLEQSDEIDRIPTVVTHLVEIAKKQMSELKAYNEKVQHLNEELKEANEKLHQLSTEDALTGLYNRRSFDDRAVQEIARTKRFGRELALAIADIDFFKDYNDHVGHPTGDRALATIGTIIRKSIRETDLAFRYGGEELAIILPETTAESATSVAERIRRAVEKQPFEGESSQPNGALTISIGVSMLGKDSETLEDFLSGADRALYKAKSMGRNRVVALSQD
jgi:diguanylate cyclase (GGDEF)-like protein